MTFLEERKKIRHESKSGNVRRLKFFIFKKICSYASFNILILFCAIKKVTRTIYIADEMFYYAMTSLYRYF